ncbi:hypothetical protein TYRP_019825 [Tyrophagus putrescentiae]|nr:hypothetical protein TYRP_019825 [Tyrophagus putrescentiae]
MERKDPGEGQRLAAAVAAACCGAVSCASVNDVGGFAGGPILQTLHVRIRLQLQQLRQVGVVDRREDRFSPARVGHLQVQLLLLAADHAPCCGGIATHP